MQRVIGFTGLPRSGKDTAASYLMEKHGFKHFDLFGNVLRPMLEEKGLAASKANAVQLGRELREKEGMGAVAVHLMKIIKESEADKIVVTGFRSIEEVEELEKDFQPFYLIEVRADRETRFARRSEETISPEDFEHREQTDLKEKGLAKVLEAAEFKMENNGTKEELFEQVEEFLKKINA
jgi:dephospho-CoA kinase